VRVTIAKFDARSESAILVGKEVMSATSAAVLESVNAVNLASRLGIGLDTLSRAIGADPVRLNNHPRDPKFQDKLRVIADLWKDVPGFFGRRRTRSFVSPLSAAGTEGKFSDVLS